MKVSLSTETRNPQSFTGFKIVKDESGFKNAEFSYPYDSNRQEVEIEFYKLGKDEYNNYYTTEVMSNYDGQSRFNIGKGVNRFDLAADFGLSDDEPFGYHYLVKNKGEWNSRVYLDAGDNIPVNGKSERVNIVLPNGSVMSKGGSMKLVIPDSQNVGVVYNNDGSYSTDNELRLRAENDVKTLWNKMGGTLAGIEKDIDEGKFDEYSRIVGLPIFARDRLSSHQYWLEEMFQISPALGNINNYASMQRKLFAHGLNWVSDGAFVNEGLQGAHFTHMLKWGVKSPFYRWFRAGSRELAPWSLGIFPNDTRNISFKLINSPVNYRQIPIGNIIKEENPVYNPKKPTYIQYLDPRYVSEHDLADTQHPITNYTVSSKENVYDLHTHNDSIFPVLLEIEPEEFDKNIDALNEYNKSLPREEKIRLKEYEGTRFVSKFYNWYVSGKHESGFETWDANPDIAKLNFVQSHTDTMALKNLKPADRERERRRLAVANAQVQDYAVEVGRYWTRTTDDILRLYIAQNLKNVDKANPKKVYNDITGKADGKIFPVAIDKTHKQLSEDEVRNVLNGEYNNKRRLSYEDKNSQILEGLMNFPLESIEFENNLVSIFASPLIAKRASNFEEVELTRYEIYKNGNPNLPKEYLETYTQMEDIYKNQMSDFARRVLDSVNESMPEQSKLFDGDEVTEFGQYTLPLILPQIAKYAIVKSLAPQTEIRFKKDNGEIVYDYDALNQVSTQSLGIDMAVSPKDEAELLLDKLREGMSLLKDEDISFMKDSIIKAYAGTSADSFKLADVIIDKTQAGLDWRIDATKDIADVEAMRNGYMDFEDTWQDIIDFWSRFARGVYRENRNSYMVAEVTNEHELWSQGWGARSDKFRNSSDINQKLIRETGMTSIADYANYFYKVVKLFARSPQDGKFLETKNDGPVVDENPNQLAWELRNILLNNEGQGSLKNNSMPSAVYSYTFFSNHDKPRPLHCIALDMEMFYSDFTFDTDSHRQDAYRLLNDDWFSNPDDIAYKASKYNFNSASPMAVAMGLHLHKALIDVLKEYESKLGERKYKKNYEAVSKALTDLSNGRYNGRYFEADAFGVKPIDINIEMVLKQAEKYYGLDMPKYMKKEYQDKVFESAMKPAMNKMLAMTKVLAALPGMPTLFDGDDLGATGYDTEKKNMYVACRQKVHNEWAQEGHEKYKPFIKDYKEKFDKVMAIRRKPECNALNNGAPFVLPMQDGHALGSGYQGKLPAVLQQSTDGRMTISVINLHKQHNEYHDYKKMYDNEQDYKPLALELDSIKLNFENSGDVKDGALGIGIPGIENGTKFQNANDPNDWYTVNEVNGKYFLKHDTNNGKIVVDDTTLVLYHVPSYTKPLSFTGSVKPNSDFVVNTYASLQKCNG